MSSAPQSRATLCPRRPSKVRSDRGLALSDGSFLDQWGRGPPCSQGSVHAGVTVLGRLKLGGQSKGFTSVAYGLRCGPSPIEGDLD
jgi:hypothetical protein